MSLNHAVYRMQTTEKSSLPLVMKKSPTPSGEQQPGIALGSS